MSNFDEQIETNHILKPRNANILAGLLGLCSGGSLAVSHMFSQDSSLVSKLIELNGYCVALGASLIGLAIEGMNVYLQKKGIIKK